MNRNSQLDSRRLNLIRQITEIEDETLLDGIEDFLIHQKERQIKSHINYPYAPTKKELHSIIEQVLEDDENGLFMDGEEFDRQMNLKMEQLLSLENEIGK
jgi:hypothetical protein